MANGSSNAVFEAFRRENRLGNRILQLLAMNAEQGMPVQNQRQLALAVGVSAPSIGSICSGETRMPSQPLLSAIAAALGTTEADLVAAAGYMEQSPLLAGIDPRLVAILRRLKPAAVPKAIALLKVLEP